MAKRNPELPGVERPTIKSLDDAIGPYLEAKAVHAEATAEIKKCKAAVEATMNTYLKVLPENANGEKCYLYQDGTKRHVATLELGEEKLSVRPQKSDDGADGGIG